jgi:putative FmdB family regulatory protein
MPTYDYECDACGHTFEQWQSFQDDALTKCPQCKKKKLRRLFGTGAAIVFKGSGFYETDYRQKDEAKKRGATAPAEGDAKPAEAKPADAKTETTPAKTEGTGSSDSGGSEKGTGKGKKADKK